MPAAAAGNFAGRGELPHDGRRGVRVQPDFAAVNFADAFDDQFRRGLLQHDAGATELHGLHEFVLVFRGGQDDHARALVGLLQGLQSGKAVQIGHAEIEQQHVGIQLLDSVQHFAAVRSFAHDLEILLQAEEFLQAVTHDGMVVGDEDSNHALPRLRRGVAHSIFFQCREGVVHI